MHNPVQCCQLSIYIGDEEILVATNLLCELYSLNRYIPPEDDWPSYHPEHYTFSPCVFNERRSVKSNDIGLDIQQCLFIRKGLQTKDKIFHNIRDLFNQLNDIMEMPITMLIEGAPGIGKTILCKEIAIQWVYSSILYHIKLLFLLCMSDPQVKNISSILFLVKYFFMDNSLAGIVAEWLIKTDGKYLTLVVDGYDEFYKDHFITNIIMRELLSKCTIVITSRPGALLNTYKNVDFRIEMLHFNEFNRQQYIQHALRGEESNKISKLENFLQSNVYIEVLCSIPESLNMLLTVINPEDDITTLPEDHVTLYDRFIVKTINCFFQMHNEVVLLNVNHLSDLPQLYHQFVMELSQFAFSALQQHKLVFALHEIETACPKLTNAYKNGMGLLKPATFHSMSHVQGSINLEALTFRCFALQEYLAAIHITSLPNQQQTEIINNMICDNYYYNTMEKYFAINGKNLHRNHFFLAKYTVLFEIHTRPAKIYNDKSKCLHIVRCLANVDKEVLANVDGIFPEGVLDFNHHSLLPQDIYVLAKLLLRLSNKQWKSLDLSYCNIDDKCCNIFCELFDSTSARLSISTVNLVGNDFTKNYFAKLCEVLKNWKINDLILSADNVLYSEDFLKLIDTCTETTKPHMLLDHNGANVLSGKLSLNYIEPLNEIFALYVDKCSIDCCHFVEVKTCKSLKSFSQDLQSWLKDLITIASVDFNVCFDRTTTAIKLSVLFSSIKRIKLFEPEATYFSNMAMATPNYQSLQWHEKFADYLSSIVSQKLSKSYKNTQTETFFLRLENLQNLRHNGFLCYANDLDIIIPDSKRINDAKLLRLNMLLNALPATVASSIINVLPISPTLKNFCFTFDKFHEVTTDVGRFLSQHSNLQELYLGNNNLQTFDIINLTNSLKNHTQLRVVDFEGSNINNEVAIFVSKLFHYTVHLEILKLCNANVQTLGASNIAKSLQSTRNLTVLDIQNNNINKEAADDIAFVLFHNAKLEQLWLGGNSMQAFGSIKIANSLQNISHLTVFDMQNNHFTKEAAESISAVLFHNTKLQQLWIGGNDIQTEGAIKVAKSLRRTTHLTVFDMQNNNITKEAADDIATVLSQNPKLQQLWIGGNILESAGAVKIAKSLNNMNDLVVFDMENTNITGEAVEDIATVLFHNAKLQQLWLGRNSLFTSGAIKIAKSLQNITDLSVFDFRNNSIAEGAANDIATVVFSNAKLEQLWLGGNNLKTVGSIKIMKALQISIHLTVFDMRNNNITEEAADDIATVLLYNMKLQQLWLGGNSLQTSGAIKIAKSLQHMIYLVVFDMEENNINKEASDDIATVLFHNTKLEQLWLGGNNILSCGAIKIAESLQNSSCLTVLDLRNNDITVGATDDIATALSQNTKLKELWLGGNNIQTSGAIKVAKSLQNTTHLTVFDMQNNNITEEAADDIATVLSHNAKLQILLLGENNIQTSGAIKIAKSLRNATHLTVINMQSNNITEEAADDFAAVLSYNDNLQELWLGGNSLQISGAIKIANSLNNALHLKVLDMRNNNVTEKAAGYIASVLSHNNKLQELWLGGNNIQTSGAIRIAKSLQNTTYLKVFDMQNNNISQEAANHIANILSLNARLQELWIGENHLQSSGAIKIAISLKFAMHLTVLDMHNNSITEKGADGIATVLCCNSMLVELRLGGNNLKTTGAIKIAKSLQNATHLTVFDLQNNHIAEEAADDIAFVLSQNTRLKKLSLGRNRFGTSGAIKIAKSLKNTRNLAVFKMQNNNITEEAAEIISKALCHNSQLQKLNLRRNDLQSLGAIKIARSLQDCQTLTEFDMKYNKVNQEAANEIARILSHNNKLLKLFL